MDSNASVSQYTTTVIHQPSHGASSPLPHTGFDVGPLFAFGVLIVLAGLLVRRHT